MNPRREVHSHQRVDSRATVTDEAQALRLRLLGRMDLTCEDLASSLPVHARRLLACLGVHQRPESGVVIARELWLDADRPHAATRISFIRPHLAEGNIQFARLQFDSYEQLLRKSHGLAPGPELQALSPRPPVTCCVFHSAPQEAEAGSVRARAASVNSSARARSRPSNTAKVPSAAEPPRMEKIHARSGARQPDQ